MNTDQRARHGYATSRNLGQQFPRSTEGRKQMIIPESRRENYEKNTLEEVICQLRFPAILKIEADSPAEFQEMIRSDYPRFDSITPDVSASTAVVRDGQLLVKGPTHGFASQDEDWQISLTKDFVALTCTNYTTWEEFVGRLESILDALVTVYRPAYFIRLGLRYKNAISKEQLGLESEPWSELLQDWALGELSVEGVREHIHHSIREVEIHLGEHDAIVRAQHGLATPEGTDAPLYLIDCDFFSHRESEIENARQVLDFLNQQSGRLFRWFIKERLRLAMEPVPI